MTRFMAVEGGEGARSVVESLLHVSRGVGAYATYCDVSCAIHQARLRARRVLCSSAVFVDGQDLVAQRFAASAVALAVRKIGTLQIRCRCRLEVSQLLDQAAETRAERGTHGLAAQQRAERFASRRGSARLQAVPVAQSRKVGWGETLRHSGAIRARVVRERGLFGQDRTAWRGSAFQIRAACRSSAACAAAPRRFGHWEGEGPRACGSPPASRFPERTAGVGSAVLPTVLR